MVRTLSFERLYNNNSSNISNNDNNRNNSNNNNSSNNNNNSKNFSPRLFETLAFWKCNSLELSILEAVTSSVWWRHNGGRRGREVFGLAVHFRRRRRGHRHRVRNPFARNRYRNVHLKKIPSSLMMFLWSGVSPTILVNTVFFNLFWSHNSHLAEPKRSKYYYFGHFRGTR